MLQVLIQGIPLLAAAGGLVFAAMQFRGWRTTQYVANFTKLVELQLQNPKDDRGGSHLSAEGQREPTRSPAEKTRLHSYALMQIGVFEIAWFTHKYGQLTDDYFASWEAAMVSIVKYPTFRAMWQTDQTKILHDGFRQYVDFLIETSSAPEHVQPDDSPSSAVEASSDDGERR